MSRFRAPGRVNLIGDHTDYNDGFVLPMAIDLACEAIARPRADGIVTVASSAFKRTVVLPADGSADRLTASPPWGRLAAGVLGALADRGRSPVGVDIDLRSDIPVGRGLSSSAAVEVALALALCDAARLPLDPLEIARACQEAEFRATGVPCGIMDQLCSLFGRRGCAILIDCRALTLEAIPLPAGLVVLVVDSGIKRALKRTAYAARRAECETIAARLGLAALRDATAEQVANEPLARHVVSENARVLDFAEALRRGKTHALGRLMLESHASLRDDFQVSIPQVDTIVDRLTDAGALGARLTGAGFGGSVVALVPAERVEAVVAALEGNPVMVCTPADGATI